VLLTMTSHILILCTHNSARSVLAEGMLNHWARLLGRDVRVGPEPDRRDAACDALPRLRRQGAPG